MTMVARAMAVTGLTSLSGSKAVFITCGISVRMLLAVIMMVWPSGGAASMACTAMAPPAPGLFSTTTGWPMSAASWSATMRATTSMVPPAGAGTSMRTGLSVQAMAAGRVSARAAAQTVRRSGEKRKACMGLSPVWRRPSGGPVAARGSGPWGKY